MQPTNDKPLGAEGAEPSQTPTRNKIENAAIGVTVAGGTAATAVGVIAAGTSATGAISAAGAAIGGVADGVLGSGVGLATGGVGMAATCPIRGSRCGHHKCINGVRLDLIFKFNRV